MKCIRCHTENNSTASYCKNCGSLLYCRRKSDRYRKKIVLAAIVILLVCLVGGFAYLVRDIILTPDEKFEATVVAEEEKSVKEEQEEFLAEPGALSNDKSPVKGKGKETANSSNDNDLKARKKVVAGWVEITDPWGRQVARFRAGLTGEGWLALPARACLGGDTWVFYPDDGPEAAISGGLWIFGDKVGLWHLAENSGSFDGPDLVAWNDREPVSWLSLESDVERHLIQLSPGRNDGFFVSTYLPDYINEFGVFVQSGKVVGWSFGQLMAKGYMWPGKAGTDLNYKTWVSYFYNITFANGREEKFAMALGMPKGSGDLDRLALFIEGFLLQPKLAFEDTPYYLLPEEIIKKMRILVTRIIRSGEGNRVVNMLNSLALKNIGDIDLFMDIVPVIASSHGFEAAIGEIEDTGEFIIRRQGVEAPALNKLHIRLYRDWLQALVSDREVDEGLQTYKTAKAYYPDDPYIHLLGVELYLLNGDWEEAERLLYMRNYPAAFQDRYQVLAARIAEMKGEEGKIVIRFPRGSDRINVTAVVNETLYQDFLVDTGATIVTIPSSMAEELGLEVYQGKRTLSTAGGVVKVSEVMIDSIEIDGWAEYNIRALVLDIPGRPGLGLLGLNYLGRFRMDLKTEDGTLLLSPR